MSDYLNKATKENMVCLAGCAGFAETLLKNDFRNKKKIKRNLQAMLNQTQKVMDGIKEGLDQDQVKSLIRYANSCILVSMPKASKAADEELFIVPKDVLYRIADDAMSECWICEKNEQDARRCKKRKDLMNAGIVTEKGGPCPYVKI